MTVAALARAAGISRQSLHHILRPGYSPINESLVSVADALGVSALCLLQEEDEGDPQLEELVSLLDAAAMRNARAFEMIPATLLGLKSIAAGRLDVPDPRKHQLLAAAAEVAASVAPSSRMESFIEHHASLVDPGTAIFFGAGLMDPERIVAGTPEPMKKHLVFGVFDLADFTRHYHPC